MLLNALYSLAPLFFVRPGELRHAEWSEFDLEKTEWRIPAEKMKMRAQHIVPLSSQAISNFKRITALYRQKENICFQVFAHLCVQCQKIRF